MYCNAHMIYMYTYFVFASIHLICSCFIHVQQHAHLELRVWDIPVKTGACFESPDVFFDVMTNFLTWRVYDIMTNFWCDKLFQVMTSWRTFWRHDELFELITNLLSWRVFDIMTNFLMSWRTFWRRDELFDVMRNFLISLRVYDIMTNFWCDKLFNVMTYVGIFDVTAELFVMTCFWLHDKPSDVMTCFLCHYELFDVMTCFWCHDKLVEMWRVFDLWQTFTSWLIFLKSWCIFWRHDKLFDIMTNFWCDTPFDVMNVLRSWRTF